MDEDKYYYNKKTKCFHLPITMCGVYTGHHATVHKKYYSKEKYNTLIKICIILEDNNG
jgi:hypothetical protein